MCGSDEVEPCHGEVAWQCLKCGHTFNQMIEKDYEAVILTRMEAEALWGQREQLKEAHRVVHNCLLAMPEDKFKKEVSDWLYARIERSNQSVKGGS